MLRPGTAVGKDQKKKVVAAGPIVAPGKKAEVKRPELEQFLEKNDYSGAITLLNFEKKAKLDRPKLNLWLGYCYWHTGEYRKALELYDEVLAKPGQKDSHLNVRLFKACCHFALGEQDNALEFANQSPMCNLRNRVLFQSALKKADEEMVREMHGSMTDAVEDQLCLAAVHFLRAHYQEATDTYKRLLAENREHWALNVYIAMCYYKMDYYDVALEILQVYLTTFPHSVVAVNLRACCHYQLYNGKAAETELKPLQQASESGHLFQDHDLLRHNLVVFRNGENALQVLPPLLDIIPEARMNMVIYYLRTDDVVEAYNLIKDLEPSVPREYVLKGVVFAALGQKTGSREHVKLAQQLFQLVGASTSECDTIPGRQCMASCFFLLCQFDDVMVYLKSIKAYFTSDDDFHWNYGVACASTGDFKEAKESLLLVQNEKYKAEFCYLSWLARCYILCNEPQHAWETYVRMETSSESFNLLHLIANDCYRMGHFYHACKAFDVLERQDPDPELWEGKRGAAVGVLQKVVAGKERPERLQEMVRLLRSTNNPQVEYMINRVMKKWAKENHLVLD
jgi:intraflagellar transport protein 56